jgi:ABC-2 type transport system ATP-binding protein
VRDIVRRAAAPRRGIVRVPAELRGRAAEALDHRGITASEAANGRQDEVELTLPVDLPAEESAEAALRCLLDAGVPVLGFTLEGGRLSDAFLSVTGEPSDE